MSVRLEIADHVARITIDRPEVLNALDRDAEAVLAEFWRRLEADREIRAVVLTGAGERAFCVGADMKNVGKSGLEYWAAARPDGFGGIA
ncbi:MAG TPA: enoyl-CoA hydratase-related protein, partial [Burkholderiaceae bacterium]|nr:enoyl-CoA hydratase-related protein [Burkholderiaceae bacterium]